MESENVNLNIVDEMNELNRLAQSRSGQVYKVSAAWNKRDAQTESMLRSIMEYMDKINGVLIEIEAELALLCARTEQF